MTSDPEEQPCCSTTPIFTLPLWELRVILQDMGKIGYANNHTHPMC